MEYYTVNIDGTEVKISEFRIKHLFGELSEIEDVNQQRATIIAQNEAKKNKCLIVASLSFYAGLIMGGELEVGKPLCFRVDIYPLKWYVTIEHLPTGVYSLHAFNMDNLSQYTRAFMDKSDALLFCANRFNENVNVKNRYETIEDLLNASAVQLRHDSHEVALAKQIEDSINSSSFDENKFAEAVCCMHKTLEQKYFRITKRCMLYRAANSRGVDGRNQASYDMCQRLSPILQESGLPLI